MDERALKILFDSYWTPAGWVPHDRRKCSDEDFEYAKSKGLMFEPVLWSHRDTLQRLARVVKRLDARVAADAFLASLSTRRLDWRSALGSYSVVRHVPPHDAVPSVHGCTVCGHHLTDREQDLSILNFERLKWGGVRHLDPVYALFDLELFVAQPRPEPTAEDFQIFRDLVSAIAGVPRSVTSAALPTHLAKILASNKAERCQLVAILGLIGVLGTREHPGFAQRFVPWSERPDPPGRLVEMPYPACWWRGHVGVNQERLREWFGYVL